LKVIANLLCALFLTILPAHHVPGAALAAPFKVLVVMSYHESMPWEKEIREGIDAELAQNSTIRYVYLNTKNDFAGGAAKAREAMEIYRDFKPDGIIAADDDAVALFLVPFIKDRVKTPAMFCGVNAEPQEYGFPASNVSGILERAHFRESIAFLRQLRPSVTKVAFLTIDNPTGRAYAQQIRRESGTYPAAITTTRLVKTLDEAMAATRILKQHNDALFLIAMEGLSDGSGSPLQEKDFYPKLAKIFSKPVIGLNEFNIRSGLLCAVVKSGQEQGATAAGMLLQAMRGAPVPMIPITTNRHGKRVLNVRVMRSMGIVPQPVFLVGTQLVDTESE